MKKIKFLLPVILIFSAPVFAQNLKVAIAANLQPVIKELRKDFKKRTGITIEPISGASGNLTSQIKNGAPYDVFLSADMSFPGALFTSGFSAKKPVVYTRGSLIICSSQNIGFENWERLLLTDRVKKIAIANPKTAPYGSAAVEALTHKGIYDDIAPNIVTGESISQVNTYIITGVVDVGFTTQALVNDPANKTTLYWRAIDQKLYSPIEQGMIITKHGAANPAASRFYHYILSAPAQAIFKKFGYR
ncbi:MAG TPA: molybdate ABC transporter substrate-binding protein [Mucilaginibacter sp.]|nr:molybdate ABC transporter substrate-binding protein [Mucilaginibacter sp.]